MSLFVCYVFVCYVFVCYAFVCYAFVCHVFFVMPSLSFCLGPGPWGPWSKAPGAHGAHMGQGLGPLGPSYRIHMESVTTYCQADYLLSGKLPTVRQTTYCQS